MTTARTPAEVLLQARHRDSQRKRARVKATVDQMRHGDAPITFAAVANAAHVSTWLVYAEGVREYIESAQAFQASTPAREIEVGTRTSAASLRTDLELARQDNRRLRTEIARLKEALRNNLGHQLDAEGHPPPASPRRRAHDGQRTDPEEQPRPGGRMRRYAARA